MTRLYWTLRKRWHIMLAQWHQTGIDISAEMRREHEQQAIRAGTKLEQARRSE